MARLQPSVFVFNDKNPESDNWYKIIIGIRDSSQSTVLTWGMWKIIRGETVRLRNANSETRTSRNTETHRDSKREG